MSSRAGATALRADIHAAEQRNAVGEKARRAVQLDCGGRERAQARVGDGDQHRRPLRARRVPQPHPGRVGDAQLRVAQIDGDQPEPARPDHQIGRLQRLVGRAPDPAAARRSGAGRRASSVPPASISAAASPAASAAASAARTIAVRPEDRRPQSSVRPPRGHPPPSNPSSAATPRRPPPAPLRETRERDHPRRDLGIPHQLQRARRRHPLKLTEHAFSCNPSRASGRHFGREGWAAATFDRS